VATDARRSQHRAMGSSPLEAPVVITCALTGGVQSKESNPNLPLHPDEIIAQGAAAAAAGASVLHVHARAPDGSNTMDPAIYRRIHDGLCCATDAIVQLTTGGSPLLSVEQRSNTIALAPEMCSLNMGLLNFFMNGREVFFPNHRSDIIDFARRMAAAGVRAELEVYSSAMLEEVEHLLDLGILGPPYVVNFVLHTPTQGGSRGTARNLVDLVQRTRDLAVPPEDLRLGVSSMGRTQLPMTTIAMAMGLNVRVGMEDNVMWSRDELVRDNAQLVERAVRIAAELQRPVATPSQARALLGL
jgi:3-keto-5-aminohexanoate cleavage enzyme